MQAKESDVHPVPCCRITDFGTRGSRRRGNVQRRAGGIDQRLSTLDQRSQRAVLIHMTGYLKAARDLISSGRKARPNEISMIFSAMEDMVNEAWKGGMI